jgi:hypothetical protein
VTLRRYATRPRQVHFCSLDGSRDADCHHVPLTIEDEALYAPVLESCQDIPRTQSLPPL